MAAAHDDDEEGGHHGGAWKVAFADFVTAMMALFLVLWLVAQSPTTKSAVGAYFRDPLGVSDGGNLDVNTGPNRGGAGFFEGGNTVIAIDATFAAGVGGGKDTSSRKRTMMELSNARNRLAQALLALRMDTWSRHVELTAVEEGLRIEIQDSADLTLFADGNAKINKKALPLLESLAKELAHLPNALSIEGHTDATGGDTNWELSAMRATAARRTLIELGVRPEQIIQVSGYANERPRLWHKPEDPSNRRISILVLLRQQSYEHRDADGKPQLENKHPLVERLKKIDYAAQGPPTALEYRSNGALQDPL